MASDPGFKEGVPPGGLPTKTLEPPRPVTKTLLIFAFVGLLLGAVSLGIGYLVWGEDSFQQGAVAFGLAYIPALATLTWALRSYRSAPEMQLMATMGGTGIRMAIALGGGFLLTQAQPQTFDATFWFWILLFYLTFLAAEITLVVRLQPEAKS